ncbi:LamG domain-containing protein [Clostridium sporogenes]|uniref:LamG domain-containing protein n=1 Tax=Clostridium sporogenes TaxID=1509 RepID=A0AAE4FPZ2_CLOSG|nr:LamG domain-containing protein [Clostridium sporogenes]MDS1005105.1 LamG domain-containing protein [Clostridium sporogenes]
MKKGIMKMPNNYSLNLNGTGYISVDNFPSFGNEYTLKIYICKKHNEFQRWTGVLMRGDSDTSQGIYIQDDNTLCVTNSKSGRAVLDDMKNYNINDWNCITITHNNETLKYYKNGKLIKTLRNLRSINSKEQLFIGYWDNWGNFNGNIAEIAIWNTCLNDKQILNNYNKKLTGKESNLVAYWRINEGEGDVIYDLSNNKFNGNVINSEWDVTAPAIICNKYLINQNKSYLSTKSNFLNLGQPTDNTQLENWYNKYGADYVNIITENLNNKEFPMSKNENEIWKTDSELDMNDVTDNIDLVNIDEDNKSIKYNCNDYRILDLCDDQFKLTMCKTK